MTARPMPVRIPWWQRPKAAKPDCPRCLYTRPGTTLRQLGANFCSQCGHLLTDHDTAKQWMWRQDQMLRARESIEST